MGVTMKDIALAAGVSVGTVDRALHNRGRIAKDVEQRILQIASQMNYQSGILGQSQDAKRKSYKIAVVLHIHQNDFYQDILAGIQKAAEEIEAYNARLTVYHCQDFDEENQLSLIDTVIREGADALVIVPINSALIAQRLKELQKEIPICFLSSYLEDVSCLCSVRCNYAQSGQIGAGVIRLISGGKGKVLLFTPSMKMAGHQLRMEWLLSALQAGDSSLEIGSIIEVPNDSFDAYNIVLKALLDNVDANLVVYCGSSKAGLKALQDCGRKIHAVFYDLSNTTLEALRDGVIDAAILQKPQEQGYTAVRVLFDYLAFKKVPSPVIELENHIVIRESLD